MLPLQSQISDFEYLITSTEFVPLILKEVLQFPDTHREGEAALLLRFWHQDVVFTSEEGLREFGEVSNPFDYLTSFIDE